MRRIRKAQAGDTIQKAPEKKSMYGSPEQRAAAKAKREANAKKIDSIVNRNASAKGMTREEYAKWQKKNAKKDPAPLPGLNTDAANKRGKSKGSCSTGEKSRGCSLKDIKRNGGKIKSKK
jgi:hypothetical protein